MSKALALTDRQARFVDAYTSNVALFNATKACRLAGYSEKSSRYSGYENVRRPHVRAAIAERLEAAFDVNELTIEKVLADLEMARICAMRDGKYHSALRAVELQGKYLHMFSTRFKNTNEMLLGEVSDSELVEMLVPLLRHNRIGSEVLAPLRAVLDRDEL